MTRSKDVSGDGFLLGFVMRTDFLADVAAKEAAGFFDFFGEMGRDFFAIFDGEVRNAKTGINNAGGDDGAGGAGLDTLCALAAEAEGLFVEGGRWRWG